VFAKYLITATVEPAVGGSVTGAGRYGADEVATLTATQNEGYTFVNWTENRTILSDQEEYSFPVTGARTLTANFKPLILTDIRVNGKIVPIAERMFYTASCEEDHVLLILNAEGMITVNDAYYTLGKTVEITDEKTIIKIAVSNARATTYYELIVAKALGKDIPLYIQRWGKTLAVINNATINGGHTFNDYRWYRNGALLPDTQGYIVLGNYEPTDYDAEVRSTKTGLWHKLCHNVISNTRSEITVYPNPVGAGQLLNLNLPEGVGKVNVRIYNVSGNLVRQQDGVDNAVTMPSNTGMYIIEIQLPDGTRNTQQVIVN
jgi:hypothetical protein